MKAGQTKIDPRVNIVVICWNGFEYSKLTIERIFQTTKIPYYLTIVDNFSTDETREYLGKLQAPSKYCKGMTFIFNDHNIGAGNAHNQGWHLSKYFNVEFTCFCDNDIYFWDGWLESMTRKMDDDHNIGAISPLRISKNTKHYIGGDSKSHFETTPKGLLPIEELKYFFGVYEIENGIKKLIELNGRGVKSFDKIPASMPAHCILVRGNVLDEVGFAADPIYEKYGSDDIDLCWEILTRGYEIAIDKDIYVHHFRHKSVINSSLDREDILRSNNLRFAEKWKLEIENIKADKLFEEKISDKDNEPYSILRHMTLSNYNNLQNQDSIILAAWGCLGKTTFCNKYSNLAIDIESSYYQYEYSEENVNIEKMKGAPNRSPNRDYPKNYADKVEESISKFKFIFVAIAPEMLEELEKKGIKYSIIYPCSSRKKIILKDAKNRGNNEHFIQKLDSILSNDNELMRLKATRKYEEIYFLDDKEYLEDIIKSMLII